MARTTSKIKLDPVGALFRNAWQLYKERFVVAIQVVMVPALLSLLGYILSTLPYMQTTSDAVMVVSYIVSFLSTFALISAIGRGTALDESYRAGISLFFPGLLIAIIMALVVFGGFIMLIIPGIVLLVWLTFSNYTLVLEGRRGFSALAQSRSYVRGYSWPVFWRMVLLTLALIFASVVGFLFLGLLLESFAVFVVQLFVTPFGVAFTYKLYENLRSLKPDAAEAATPAAGKDFFVVSMIVGIAAAAGIFVLAVFFPARVQSSFENSSIGKYINEIEMSSSTMPGAAPIVAPSSSTSSTATSSVTSTVPVPPAQSPSMFPESGVVGDGVTITMPAGALGSTTTVFMKGMVAAQDVQVKTVSGKQEVRFIIPQALGPNCKPSVPCPQVALVVTQGAYQVSVSGANGATINVGYFMVLGEPTDPVVPPASS